MLRHSDGVACRLLDDHGSEARAAVYGLSPTSLAYEPSGSTAHEQHCKRFNTDFRQLIHISFRVAAEMGERYLSLLKTHRTEVEACVSDNILKRHVEPLFLGSDS